MQYMDRKRGGETSPELYHLNSELHRYLPGLDVSSQGNCEAVIDYWNVLLDGQKTTQFKGICYKIPKPKIYTEISCSGHYTVLPEGEYKSRITGNYKPHPLNNPFFNLNF